jgi:membrane protease YdiL (CAAX protease family)
MMVASLTRLLPQAVLYRYAAARFAGSFHHPILVRKTPHAFVSYNVHEMNDEPNRSRASADDVFAARLRGFGLVGLLAILIILLGNLVFLPLSAILILAWVALSRTPWREIGFVRPKSWMLTIGVGIFFGVAFKFLMKSIVMPLFGADPINQAYHYLAGNRAAIPATLYLMIVVAGFGEETFFRGYLFERLGKLLGTGAVAKILIVLITSVFFGLGHYANQGLTGVEQATIVGLVYGTIFALTGRIVLLMIAHAAFDLTAYALIYWNLETKVAHLVFR